MRVIHVVFFALTAVLLLAALWWASDVNAMAAWAAHYQRGFQNDMASAVRALRMGTPGAWAALLGAAGAYGFVHAVGPGHGKYLIGGVGLGSSVSLTRLLGVAAASSLAQSLWAIVLVYGGFFLIEGSARRMTALAEDYLAPASYIAIGSVGVVLAWRGVRKIVPLMGHTHHTGHGGHCECCGHSHGPSVQEVAALGSLRETAALILSIAMRPCTGAIFLLVIAWQMHIRLAGAAAVVVMGMGTAALTGLVAVSSIAARGAAFASADRSRVAVLAIPAIQVLAGILITWTSAVLLSYALR